MRTLVDSWRLRQGSSSCTNSQMSRTTRGIVSRRKSTISWTRSTAHRSHSRLNSTMSSRSGDRSSKTLKKTSRYSLKSNNSRTDTYLVHFNLSFRSSPTSLRSWRDHFQTTVSRFHRDPCRSTTVPPLAALREACVERNFIYYKLYFISLSS
jgi:hypothetical protein